MLSARCLDDARYENTRRYKYFGGLPASGPLRGTAGRGEKIFRNDRNLSDYHSEKSKRVVFPSNRRQKLLAQARPERRRADPHQREGTIPRRDMGAAAPTYRLSETYPHKMTKSQFCLYLAHLTSLSLHKMLAVHILKFGEVVHRCRDDLRIVLHDCFGKIPENLCLL